MIFPKKQNIVFSNLNKAYVEGIYNDSPLNRKLGRVGMSYKEYMNALKERGEYQEGHTEKREKNEIPVNIGDLDFDKEGKAHYEVNGKKIDIELISHVKHGDKNFTLKVDGKEYKDLNTTQLARRLKAISKGQYDFTDSDRKMSDTIPLSKEEFDDLYGDIGFNYTYYKDNLDIKVWIREDSNSKDPRFNIYVIDTKTKKKKSFNNLSLLEAHNKLLEYDLNPDVEKPLSKKQLRELRKIKIQQGIIKRGEDEVDISEEIGIDFDERGYARFKIDGGYISLKVSKANPSTINVIVLDEKGNIQGLDYTDVDNFKSFIDNYGLDLNKDNQIDQFEFWTNIDKPLNEIVENYYDKESLFILNGILNWSDYYKNNYEPTSEDSYKLKNEIFAKKLGKFKNSKRDWNKGLRDAYVFINSDKLVKWLKDMPNSHKEGVSKKKIYNDIKTMGERFSPGGNINGIYDIPSLQNYIIKEYY